MRSSANKRLSKGWNPTWDRFVTEDFILKDTTENRQLQKELAEKAQLTSTFKIHRGGNWYKRDRKKQRSKLSIKGSESLEASAASTAPNADEVPVEDSQDSTALTPAPCHDELSDSSVDAGPVPITIPLSDNIRHLLENDYHLVTQSNKLLKLPAKPNVLTILENYVIDYAMNLVSSNQEKSTRSSTHPPLSLDVIRRNINLCKEVADGLRIYFDFTLRDFLLYNLERDQCNQMFFNFKIEPNSEAFSSPVKQEEVENGILPNANACPTPCSPVYSDKEAPHSTDGSRRKSLRSHRTGGFEFTNGTTGKSAPLLKEENLDSTQSLNANSVPQNTPARQETFITQIMEWKLVPPNVLKKLPLSPSQIYGATHLARLFVKLPELMPSGMAEKKLDICLRHFASILKYLEAHPEWFDESHYQENCLNLTVPSESMSN